jgi:hypothetical protein
MMRGTVLSLALAGVFLTGAAPLHAADAEAVKAAIAKGVAYLKGLQRENGTWQRDGANQNEHIGATALAGLTLLECGMAADDPAVLKAAAAVRGASINLTTTYCVSLAILFLDRLGDPQDVPFIESLTLKLLAGQSASSGGWGYECPAIAPAEVERLQKLLKQRNELTAGQGVPSPKGRREVKDLPREVRDQLDQINRQADAPGPQAMPLYGDNSNTQFAILALWVGRRQGLPVGGALARVDNRFRTAQMADGGWTYSRMIMPGRPGMPDMPGGIPPGMPKEAIAHMPGLNSSPAMTCAGLLGLAVATGSVNEEVLRHEKGKDPKREPKLRDPGNDAVIKKGLLALGSSLDIPADRPDGFRGLIANDMNGKAYYFLWSLERVGVAYGLDTIGNKDWYNWGADILLANQQGEGGWQAEYSAGGCDTCFALLFLRRANLAQDLSSMLKGKVSDPDQRELRTGGVGGSALKSKPIGLKPAFGNEKKSPEESSGGSPSGKPGAGAGSEAGRLGDDLVRGPEARQQEALEKLRDSKGAAYTEALAGAIPKLGGAMKTKAREALADRLSRMTPATLAERLQDPDAEMRRAAALACAMKDERSQIPRLIELLEDKEATVVRAAHAALKALAGKDVGDGPAADATPAEHAKAVAAWKAWWEKEKAK